jgi:hypothetical protein
MQNIEHDMDELFRKAVDQVPLLPNNSRWNEIAGKISGNLSVSSAKQKETNTKRIMGLLGFFLLGIISSGILTTFIKYNNLNIPGNHFNKTRIIGIRETVNSKSHTSNTILLSTIKPSYFYPSITNAGNQPSKVDPGLNIDDRICSSKRLNTDIQVIHYNSPLPSVSGLSQVAYDGLLQKHSSVDHGNNLNNPTNLPSQNLNKSYVPHFYLGLAGGIFMSQIRNQGLTKPGYDIGLLVGYKINKILSVETGLLYSKQYYFAGGKYYNSVTGGSTAKSLEGSRTAYEIPFKLNYFVLHNKKGSFFVSGGVSSYVGVNDKILINVGENSPGPSQKLDYGVASYLPSYLDFSLGYDHQFGRLSHIRIEPFVEIPMSSTAGNTINIKAGNALPVVNAGLHLVITEFIH